MVIRKLFGAAFAGDALTDKALSNNATRTEYKWPHLQITFQKYHKIYQLVAGSFEVRLILIEILALPINSA